MEGITAIRKGMALFEPKCLQIGLGVFFSTSFFIYEPSLSP